MNKNIAQLNKLLKGDCDLVNNVPNDLKLVLTLHEQNVKFTMTHINNLTRKLVEYEEENKFLSEIKNDEQKNCIKILFTQIITKQEDINYILQRQYRPASYLAELLFESNGIIPKDNFIKIINNLKYIINVVPTILKPNTILQFLAHLKNSKQDDILWLQFIELIKKSNDLSQSYILTLIEYMQYFYSRYDNYYCKEPHICVAFMELLKKTIEFDKDIFFDTCIKMNITNDEITECIIRNVGYNDKYTKYVLSSCSILLLFELILVGYVPTVDTINILFRLPNNTKRLINNDINNKYNNISNNIKEWFQQIINVNTQKMSNVAVGKKIPVKKSANTNKRLEIGNDDIFKLFEVFNLTPNIETIDILISKNDSKLLESTLSNNFVSIDKSLLDKIIKTYDEDLIKKILDYKIIPDEETFNTLLNHYKGSIFMDGYNFYVRNSKLENIVNIIEQFICYGFQIKMNHIIDLLSIHKHLEQLERFDIAYDENLYYFCYIHEYYPEEYMKKYSIDSNILILRKYYVKKTKKTIDIFDFIKTHNLKIDRYVISSLFTNNPVICNELITKYKIMPDLLTLYQSTTQFTKLSYTERITICNQIIEINNINKDFMMENFDILNK